MNRFSFVAPMFNASETLERMLHSIYGQSYNDWRIFLIDDVSDPEHRKKCSQTIDAFRNFGSCKINVTWNDEKLWEVANVLNGISMCDDNDIVVRIDADDWICDLDALAIINQCYTETGCDTLWTAHRWGFSDQNISGPMAQTANPYKHPWVSSHMKTFRKRLINDVNDANFRGEDGKYIKRAGDQAIYLPVLHKSKMRVFLPRVMYHYTIDDIPETYQTADAKFQKSEAEFLRYRGFVE